MSKETVIINFLFPFFPPTSYKRHKETINWVTVPMFSLILNNKNNTSNYFPHYLKDKIVLK